MVAAVALLLKPSQVSRSRALLPVLKALNVFGDSPGRVTVRFQVWLLLLPLAAAPAATPMRGRSRRWLS